MKKILYAAVLALLCFVSCRTDDHDKPVTPTYPDIKGSWELTSVQAKSASIGGTAVDVYMDFDGAGAFTLYQRLGSAGHFTMLTGTYTYSEGVLSGKYSSGTSLGSTYTVTSTGTGYITLTDSTDKVADTYKSISAIPDSVKESVL